VRGFAVGAFALSSSASRRAAGGATGFGASAGGHDEQARTVIRSGGTDDACRPSAADPPSGAPPNDCRTPLQLFLVPIPGGAPAHVQAPAPTEASPPPSDRPSTTRRGIGLDLAARFRNLASGGDAGGLSFGAEGSYRIKSRLALGALGEFVSKSDTADNSSTVIARGGAFGRFHFVPSGLIDPWAGPEIVFSSLSTTFNGQTSVLYGRSFSATYLAFAAAAGVDLRLKSFLVGPFADIEYDAPLSNGRGAGGVGVGLRAGWAF
jgi:hypothetical protein